MILTERRKELGLSQDKLHQLSGVPRYRINRLELGLESISSVPFYQIGALASVLDIPLTAVYTYSTSDVYKKWTHRRCIEIGQNYS